MRRVAALLLLIPGALGAQQNSRERAITDSALAAALQGTLAEFRLRWERAPATVDRRLVALALGSAARLEYRFADAARLLRTAEGDTTKPDALTAHAALGLAWVEAQQFNAPRAISLLLRARAFAARSGAIDVTAEAMLRLVPLRQRTNGVAAALATADSAERLFRSTDKDWQLELTCRRAQATVRAGDPAGLRAALIGAAHAESTKSPRVGGHCWLAVAQSHSGNQRLRDAAYAFGRAADQFDAGHDQSGLSAALQWKGFTRRQLGDFDSAQVDFERAIRAGTISGNRSPVGWAWLGLSQLSMAAAEPVRAADEVQRGRRVLAEIGDRWGLASATVLGATAAHQLGDLRRAREKLLEAIAQEDALGNTTDVLIDGAPLIDIERDMYGESAALARIAWLDTIARRAQSASWENERQYHLALLALRRGDAQAALERLRRFQAGDDATSNAIVRFEHSARIAEAYTLTGDALRGARLLDSAITALASWRARISDRALRLASLSRRSLDPDPDLGIATIIARAAAAGHDTLALRLAGARSARTFRTPVTRVAVRAARPHELVLQFVTGRRGEPTTLFMQRGSILRSAILPPIDSLIPDIAALRSLVAGDAAAPDLSRSLGAQLLGPALALADASTRYLVIRTDGLLHGVPWAMLTLPNGQQVIDRFTVSSESPAVASPALAGPPIRREIVALGLAQGAAQWDGAPLAPLPRAEAEAQFVASMSRDGLAIIGAAATERAVRRLAAAPPSILHVAMHAIVDDRSASRAAVVLRAADGDDGLLTADELVRLRLPSELVVLSGCSTASGRVLAAEGVQGLLRPLFDAGVQAVVATQWPTGDAGAARMMEWFYAELASGQTTSDALREAQLRARRAGIPIRDWAGWSYVGDPLATVSATFVTPRSATRAPVALSVLAGVLAVLATFGWVYRTSIRRVSLRT